MGIGREIALAFAREGANLVLAARSKDKLDSVGKEIATIGSEALAVPTDVTQPDQVESLLKQAAEKFGRLDVLVNNAGRGLYNLIENTDPKDFIEIFDLNVFSVLRLTKFALPLLKKSLSPKIINLSSVAGHLTGPKMSAYCASKYALNSLSEGMRMEFARDKIRVLSVYPGITDTDFSTNARSIDGRPTSYVTRGRGTPARKVAEKIVRAAARGRSEAYINLLNHLAVWFHFLFPRFFEWVLRTFVK
jgi:short-subunit dehydrogenase